MKKVNAKLPQAKKSQPKGAEDQAAVDAIVERLERLTQAHAATTTASKTEARAKQLVERALGRVDRLASLLAVTEEQAKHTEVEDLVGIAYDLTTGDDFGPNSLRATLLELAKLLAGERAEAAE